MADRQQLLRELDWLAEHGRTEIEKISGLFGVIKQVHGDLAALEANGEPKPSTARPDWSVVAQAVREARESVLNIDPGLIGSVDAGQMALLDAFAMFGVNLRDEVTLHVALTSVVIFGHMAKSTITRERMSEEGFAGMLGMLNAVAAGLSDFMPDDVK